MIAFLTVYYLPATKKNVCVIVPALKLYYIREKDRFFLIRNSKHIRQNSTNMTLPPNTTLFLASHLMWDKTHNIQQYVNPDSYKEKELKMPMHRQPTPPDGILTNFT